MDQDTLHRNPPRVIRLPLLFLTGFCSFVAIESKAEVDFDALMALSLEDLMHAEVTTASKKVQNLRDIPASVVVISRSDIAQKGYRNLADIFADIPGFYVIASETFNGDIVGVRGSWTSTARNVKLLVNGDDIVNDANSDYNTRQLPVPISAIEKIELVRGPMSVLYGSGALFGVINIITKPLQDNEVYTEARVAVGSHNLRSASVRAVAAGTFNNEWPVSLSANLMQESADREDKKYSDFAVNTDQVVGDPGGDSTEDKLRRKKLYFDANIHLGDISINFLHGGSNTGVLASSTATIGDGSIIHGEKTLASVSYFKQVNDAASFTIKYGSSRYMEQWRNRSFVNEWNQTLDKRSQATFFEIDGFYDISDSSSLVGGFSQRTIDEFNWDWNFYIVKFAQLRNLKAGDERRINSFYFQFSQDFSEALGIVVGFRAERESAYDVLFRNNVSFDALTIDFNVDGSGIISQALGEETLVVNGNRKEETDIIPRLALLYKFDNHVLKLLYGEAINRPGMFQQADAGGKELEAEKIQTLELVAQGALFKKVNYSISLFRNETEDLATRQIIRTEIDPVTGVSDWVGITASAGSFETNGFELSINYLPIDEVNIDFSLTAQNTKDTRDGMKNITPANSPKLLAYFNVNYEPLSTLSINLSARYVSKMESEWHFTADNPEGSRVGAGSDAYSLFDLSSSWKVYSAKNNKADLNLRFGIYNLFDKAYKAPSHSEITWADKGIPGDSRSFQLGAVYDF